MNERRAYRICGVIAIEPVHFTAVAFALRFLLPAQILIDNLPESATEEEVKKLAEEKGGPVSQSNVTPTIAGACSTFAVHIIDRSKETCVSSVKLILLYQQGISLYNPNIVCA